MNIEVSKKQLLAILKESSHTGDVDEMSWVNPAPHLGIPVKKGKSEEPASASFTNDPNAPTGEVEGAHWRAYNAMGVKRIAVGPLEGADFKSNQEFYDYLKVKNPGFLKDLQDFEAKGYKVFFNIDWVPMKYDPINATKSKIGATHAARRRDIDFPLDTQDVKALPLSDYIHRSILGNANKFLTYNAKEPIAQAVTKKLHTSLLPEIISNNLNRSKGQEKAQKQTTKTISVTNEKIEWVSWNDITWDSFDRFIEVVSKAKENSEFTKGKIINKDRQYVEKQRQKQAIVDNKVGTGNRFNILGEKVGDSFKWTIKVEFFLGIGVDLTQDEDFDVYNIPKGTTPIKSFEASTVSKSSEPAGNGPSVTENVEVASALKEAMKQVADQIIGADLLGDIDKLINSFINPAPPAGYQDFEKQNKEKEAPKKRGGKKIVANPNLSEERIVNMVNDILNDIKK